MIVITGRTASGKSTLAERLEQHGYSLLKTYTTRPRRADETNEYHFIDNPEAYDGRMLETTINGHRYFTRKTDIHYYDMMVVDANGVIDMALSGITPQHIIFIDIDTPTRQKRYMKRNNDDAETFQKRNHAEADAFEDLMHLLRMPGYRRKYQVDIARNEIELDHVVKGLTE